MTRILYYADVENAYDDPGRIGRLAGLIGRLRDATTVVCGGGDNTAPGVLALKADGYAALPFFRAVEPDVETLGNHEFDRPLAALRELIRKSPQTWVCANARDGEGRFGAEDGVVPWTVIGAGGERVGVFGVASPATDEISPLAAALEFTDPVAAAREAVERLRDEGVDHVVGLSHVGDDEPLARALDVPAILGGHVHDCRDEVVDGTLLIRPGAGGHRLVELELDGGVASARWHRTREAAPDPAVVEAYRDRRRALGLDEVVATLEEPVERVASRGESAIGNFAADALRRAAGADVGLMHGGSIRDGDPLTDEVTVEHLISLVPFENDVVAVEVSGERLLGTIRAAAVRLDRREPRWYGQLSNARVVWDERAGELVSVRVGGESVDPDRRYVLGTHSYVVRDGGLFRSLGPSLPTERVGTLHDALIEHARRAGIPAESGGRIERRNLPGER